LKEAAERLAQEAELRRLAEEAAASQARRSAVRSRRFSYALGALFLIAAVAALFARRQQLTAQSRALAAQAEEILARDRPAALDAASQPTASALLPPATTIRRGCGTRPTANCWPSSKATRGRSWTRPSRPTASASSPPARTVRHVSTV
jgi:hypothetical protein